jgi:hypothetical protein
MVTNPTPQDVSYSLITDEGMHQISLYLSNIAFLDMSSCRYVTAKTVNLLQDHNRLTLTDLVLSKCGMVKLSGLTWDFPYLERLEVAQYFVANDGILYSLARNCPSLQKLVLAGCHSICTDGISPPLSPSSPSFLLSLFSSLLF